MRVPVEWLREYVYFSLTVPELAEGLEMLGLKPESVVGEGEAAVLELEITSNRGDCLSMIGVAREVAACAGSLLREPEATVPETDEKVDSAVEVVIEDEELCPRYTARLIRGISIRPSPPWMQRRLEAAGMRPINNIVDITNYVMLETGQPLHAFDYHRLRKGNDGRVMIVVRRARVGEKLVTIDDVERDLTPAMLMIADAEVPVALGGVMGGRDSEVTGRTKDVLLESAHFHPGNNRRTAKALNLPSEATRRFQRYVDPNGCLRASDRAAALMAELAGGQVLCGTVDVYPLPRQPRIIELRVERCNQLLGTELTIEEMSRLLGAIGLQSAIRNRACAPQSAISVQVPPRRPDLTEEADLVEEVARLHGYDRIATTLHAGVADRPGESERLRLERRARETLMACGLHEINTFSLVDPVSMSRAGMEPRPDAFRVRNPLTEDATEMRTSIVPSLLGVLARNARAGLRDVHFFELGRVYLRQEGQDLADERRTLGLAAMGEVWNHSWNLKGEGTEDDFFSIKGVVEELLRSLRVSGATFSPGTHPSFHAARCATIEIAGEVAGVMGEVDGEIAQRLDLPTRAYMAELDFEVIARHSSNEVPRYQSIARFPVVRRDLALVVEEALAAARVKQEIERSGGGYLREAEIFDVFRGGAVPEGKKSLAYALTFRADDRTLTDAEVEAVMQAIRQGLSASLNAVLR